VVKIGKRVDALIADGAATRAISEITLAEAFSTICSLQRGQTLGYDGTWARAVEDSIMGWISSGNVLVLPLPPKLVEKAIYYVLTATREHGRDLRAWDAAHLYHAAVWAKQVGNKVHLVTNDKDFPKILDVYPEFRQYVDVLDPET